MRKYKICLLATCLIPTAILAADSPAREFDWLSGHWCGRSGDQVIEEFWLPAAGDIAIGVGRTVKDGKTVSHEFMRIVTRDGVTSFIAVLEGQPPTAFKLIASGKHWARFENPQHDFPQRIEIRRTETGLHAEIAGPGKDGKEEVIPVDYTRCVD
jgi:uncharacterized protein DUF6265